MTTLTLLKISFYKSLVTLILKFYNCLYLNHLVALQNKSIEEG